MKRKLFLFFLSVPVFLNGAHYVGNGHWRHIEFLSYEIGTPSNMSCLRAINFTFGTGARDKGKAGIGLGASITMYSSNDWDYDVVGIPLYFCFVIPLENLSIDKYPLMFHFSPSPFYYHKTSEDSSSTVDTSWYLGIAVSAGIDIYNGLFGVEVGYLQLKDETKIYAGIKGSIGAWIVDKTKKLQPPSISINSFIVDANGNGILQGRENAKLSITLRNQSSDSDALKGRLTITLLSPEYQNKISFIGFKKIDKIPKNGEVHIKIPVNTTTADIPQGELKFEIKYEGKSKWGDEITAWNEVSIPTKPTKNLIKVAFIGFLPTHLPLYIIKVPVEKAEYVVSYKDGEVHILNVKTGELVINQGLSEGKVMSFINSYFKGVRD